MMSTAMTAALSAELDDSVPIELIAEIVRSVLDEGRQAALNAAEGAAMIEARLRIERFIRARTPSARTPG
jgi:hypothetical protein